MNHLSAIRTFGKPGYTPAKHTRIYDNRWYLCTFQNVETDSRFDYVGLGKGEYQELLPGLAAIQARDAHLNHLNALREWTGPVFRLAFIYYTKPDIHYYPTREAAEKQGHDWANEHETQAAASLAASLRLYEKLANLAWEDARAKYPLIKRETYEEHLAWDKLKALPPHKFTWEVTRVLPKRSNRVK